MNNPMEASEAIAALIFII